MQTFVENSLRLSSYVSRKKYIYSNSRSTESDRSGALRKQHVQHIFLYLVHYRCGLFDYSTLLLFKSLGLAKYFKCLCLCLCNVFKYLFDQI